MRLQHRRKCRWWSAFEITMTSRIPQACQHTPSKTAYPREGGYATLVTGKHPSNGNGVRRALSGWWTRVHFWVARASYQPPMVQPLQIPTCRACQPLRQCRDRSSLLRTFPGFVGNVHGMWNVTLRQQRIADRKTKKKRKTRSTHARTHARGMAVSKITPSDTPALLRRQHDPHNAMLNEHWNSAVPHRTTLDVLGFVLFILEQYWNQFAPNIFDVIRNLVHHQCHRWLFRIQRHGIHLEFNKIGK